MEDKENNTIDPSRERKQKRFRELETNKEMAKKSLANMQLKDAMLGAAEPLLEAVDKQEKAQRILARDQGEIDS